ncbi:MAG: hypothetical protein ACWGOV_08340 [Acidiferrobacterales bacterium]
MNHLLNLFLRMWVLRANPQDLPASRTLAYALVALYVFVSIASMFGQLGIPRALAAAVIDTTLLIAPVVALLAISGFPERSYQTVSAILGASIALVVALVFLGAFISSQHSLQVIQLLALAWYVLIFGHVLRQAVALPVLLGATFAFIYVMVSDGLIRALFLSGTGAVG